MRRNGKLAWMVFWTALTLAFLLWPPGAAWAGGKLMFQPEEGIGAGVGLVSQPGGGTCAARTLRQSEVWDPLGGEGEAGTLLGLEDFDFSEVNRFLVENETGGGLTIEAVMAHLVRGDLAGLSDAAFMGDLAGMPDADLTGDLPGMSDSGLADGMPEMAASGAADDLQGEKMETLPDAEESGPDRKSVV